MNAASRPVVLVAVSPNGLDQSLVRQVLLGLEEESVPAEVVEWEQGRTAEELAHEAAARSPLGVGVGIGKDAWVVVHHRRLRKSSPLFRVHGRTCPADMVRDAGHNAARLVKGVPFKWSEYGEPVCRGG